MAKRKKFTLKSGNNSSFKMMGASPMDQETMDDAETTETTDATTSGRGAQFLANEREKDTMKTIEMTPEMEQCTK